MSVLTDQQAIDARGARDDLLRNRSVLELSDIQRGAVDVLNEQLTAYEKSVKQRGGVAYQLQPQAGYSSIMHSKKLLNREIPTGGEHMDSQQLSNAVGVRHMSAIFGKSQDEIIGNLPSYQKVLMDAHGVQDFHTALSMDLDKRAGQFELFNNINRDAQASAARGENINESISRFFQENELTAVDDKIISQYIDSYTGSLDIFKENKEELDAFASDVQSAVEDVEVFQQGDFFNAVERLADMPEDLRYAALVYAEQRIGLDDNGFSRFKKLFEAREGQLLRGIIGMTPRDLMGGGRDIVKAIEAGEDVFVLRAAGDDRGGTTLDAAQRIAYTSTKKGTGLYYRDATHEERVQRIKDAHTAAKVGKAMLDVEQFMQGTLADTSGIDNASLKWVADNITYPFATMSADLVNIIGQVTIGSKTAGLFKAGQMTQRALGTVLAYNSSRASLQREHFNTLIQEQPDLDLGVAYELSGVSGNIAAVWDTASTVFMLGKLPGVSGAIGSITKPQFLADKMARLALKSAKTHRAIRATLVGFSTAGLEAVTEVMQSVTLDATQEIMSGWRKDIPDIEFWDKFEQRFVEELKPNFLAMLPLALISGGKALFVRPDVASRLINSRKVMEESGFSPEIIDSIEAAETDAQKIEIFKKHWDMDAVAAYVEERDAETGTTFDERTADPEATQGVKEAEKLIAEGQLEVPAIVDVIDPVTKNVIGYEVQVPGGNVETYSTKAAAQAKIDAWASQTDLATPKEDFVPNEPVEIKVKLDKAKPKSAEAIQFLQEVQDAVNQKIERLNELGIRVPDNLRARLENPIKEISIEAKAPVRNVVGQSLHASIRQLDTLIEQGEKRQAKAKADAQQVKDLEAERDDLRKEIEDLEKRDDVPAKELEDRDAKIKELEQEIKDLTKKISQQPPPQPKTPEGSKEVEQPAPDGETETKVEPPVDQSSDQSPPPPMSDDVLSPKNAHSKKILEDMGQVLPEKEKRAFAQDLAAAEAESTSRGDAQKLVNTALQNPDVVNSKDQAKMLLYERELILEIESLEAQLEESYEKGDPIDVKSTLKTIEQLQGELANVARALNMVGTEIARALAFRRILIDKANGSIAKIKQRAKVAGKGKIDPKIEKELEAKAKELAKVNAQLEKLAKENAKLNQNLSKAEANQAFDSQKKKAKQAKTPKQKAIARRKAARKRLTKKGYC